MSHGIGRWGIGNNGLYRQTLPALDNALIIDRYIGKRTRAVVIVEGK